MIASFLRKTPKVSGTNQTWYTNKKMHSITTKIGKAKSYCQTFSIQQPCSQDCTRPIKKSYEQQHQTQKGHSWVVLTQEKDGGKLTQDFLKIY